jgi:glucose-1-phosphate adenylyltransferase
VTISDAIVLADAVVPDGFDLDAELTEHGRWCVVSEGGIRVISARALQRLASRRRREAEPSSIGGFREPDRRPRRAGAVSPPSFL